jgi:hypothetical protein
MFGLRRADQIHKTLRNVRPGEIRIRQERKDAEQMAEEKRRVAKQNLESLTDSREFIKTFRRNAENARATADRARKI